MARWRWFEEERTVITGLIIVRRHHRHRLGTTQAQATRNPVVSLKQATEESLGTKMPAGLLALPWLALYQGTCFSCLRSRKADRSLLFDRSAPHEFAYLQQATRHGASRRFYPTFGLARYSLGDIACTHPTPPGQLDSTSPYFILSARTHLCLIEYVGIWTSPSLQNLFKPPCPSRSS